MGAEEDIAREGFELGEGMGEVLRDAGVGGRMAGSGDEAVLVERGDAANDDDVEGFVVFYYLRGPGGATWSVAGGLVRR